MEEEAAEKAKNVQVVGVPREPNNDGGIRPAGTFCYGMKKILWQWSRPADNHCQTCIAFTVHRCRFGCKLPQPPLQTYLTLENQPQVQ